MEPAFDLSPVSDRAALRSPVLQALFDAWQAGCDGRSMPRALLPGDVGQARDHLWVLDTIDGGADFHLRFVGSQADRIYGGVPAGIRLLDLGKRPFVGRALRLARAPVQDRVPFRFFSGESVIPGSDFYDVEALALPVSADGETVTTVVGATVVRNR